MTATVPFIADCFRRFNERYFESSLPEIPIRLSNARGFLGKLTYTRVHSFWRTDRCENFVLRINTRIDLTQSELEDTIIHEMIHYYIIYHRLGDTSAHGTRFRAMMTRINRLDDRHVRISYRLSPDQQSQAAHR